MSNRFLTVIVACGAILVSSEALALRRVTTDDCLAKGQCAFVSPKGRVTCGRCPAPPHAVAVPVRATALCKDDTWNMRKTSRGACSGHGGVKVLLRP
jgi:hypothetical protein